MNDTFVDTLWVNATKAAATGSSFARSDQSALNGLTPSQLDALPYGAVRLDDNGVVKFFNRYESELGGIPAQAAVGKNFFTEIAPCTNNKVFRGCFAKAIAVGNADALFSYTFTYKMRPTEVDVHVHRAQGSNWVLIKKK